MDALAPDMAGPPQRAMIFYFMSWSIANTALFGARLRAYADLISLARGQRVTIRTLRRALSRASLFYGATPPRNTGLIRRHIVPCWLVTLFYPPGKKARARRALLLRFAAVETRQAIPH